MDKINDNHRNLKSCYAIIAQCRDYHKYNQSRRISDKTRQTYNHTAERLIFKDKRLPIDSAMTKSSYYVYKAAVSSYILDKISETLPSMDGLKIQNINAWHEEIGRLKKYLDFLAVVGVDQKKEKLNEALTGNYQSKWTEKSKTIPKKPRRSKSRRLNTLPKDWNTKIFEAALKSKSRYANAIAVLSITGCRSSELSGNGVQLALNDDGKIQVTIHGAKCREGQGQTWRSFTIYEESIEFAYLLDELKKNNGRLTVRAKPGALCDKVAYLSRRAMPQLKEQATSYCYRHRFSGALHHAGLDAESIGKSLGHIVDQSSQHYGKGYRSAATSFLISDIQAAKPVKLKNRIRANNVKESSLEQHLTHSFSADRIADHGL